MLHVVPLMSTRAEYGGPAKGTLRQADRLARAGHDVAVVTLWRGAVPAAKTENGARVIAFPARHIPFSHQFGGLFSVAPLLWLARSRRTFDVLHVHAGRELWVLLFMLFARLLRLPFVVQTHGMLNPRGGFGHRLFDTLLTAPAYRKAATAFYLTNYERRSLERLRWFRRLDLLVNGVDAIADQLPPETLSPEMHVITTARLHPRKHIPDLVDAVARVAGMGVPIDLRIYGPDEGDLDQVRARIAANEAESYVSYGGPIDYSRVGDELLLSNVYVLPSRAEPFPNSLLEALCRGLASVCTTECGLAPYISKYEAGIVVEPGVDGITKALLELVDPAVRELLGERALQMCEAEFSMNRVLEMLAAGYAAATSDR